MITYWQQIHGKLVRVKKDELNSELKTWVDARAITPAEISELEKMLNL